MAHLLIIELPGGNDLDIVQAAIDRGDEFTFLSAQLDHYRKQPSIHAKLARARELIEVAPFEYAEVERCVLAAHAQHRIDGVLCLLDIRVIEAARLAARLDVPYLNVSSAVLLRDKYAVRKRLAERGIWQPEFALADSTDALNEAVKRLGLPVLIKPVDGYGSQNIVAIRYAEDLDPLLSPLDDLLPCNNDYGLGVTASGRLLVERFMTGTVIGCDTLTVNGQHTLLGINEKLFFEAPSFAIRGGCFTPNSGAYQAIESYLFSVLNAVEFDWGAAHTELMLTADGPRVIEINPRLVGAKIPRLIGYSLDRSIYSDLIALHIGEPTVGGSPEVIQVAVTRWIVAEQPGILDCVELPDWHDPRIRCVEILKSVGDFVRPPFENADRIGYVMVCGPTRHEAEALAERFVAGCRVCMQAGTLVTTMAKPQASYQE
jgi:biotin carboxylase